MKQATQFRIGTFSNTGFRAKLLCVIAKRKRRNLQSLSICGMEVF